MKAYRLSRILLIGCISLSTTEGALITSSAQIGQPQAVIDFKQFAGANAITTRGPIDIGDGVTFQSTNPDGSTLGSHSQNYELNDNGTWNSSRTFAALEQDYFGHDQYTMTFSFNGRSVAAVGGLMNYAFFHYSSGFSDVIITALASDGSILESYDISQLAPISTPGGTDMGAFRGIGRGQADIAAFSLSNSAVAVSDLTFSSNAVPEPCSWYLSAIGLFALAVWLRSSQPRSRAFNE